jgi:uncharacterized coiled-coil protein SlyX
MADTVIKTLAKMRELDAHHKVLTKHKKEMDKLRPKLESLAKKLSVGKPKKAGKKKPMP